LTHDPDVLVLGGGPAALCIVSELVRHGVCVEGIAPESVHAPWPNTYGIWASELECLGLQHLLAHRWSDTVSYFGEGGGRIAIGPRSTASTTACSTGLRCNSTGWRTLRV
jgi:lycopene beta-cyclase